MVRGQRDVMESTLVGPLAAGPEGEQSAGGSEDTGHVRPEGTE